VRHDARTRRPARLVFSVRSRRKRRAEIEALRASWRGLADSVHGCSGSKTRGSKLGITRAPRYYRAERTLGITCRGGVRYYPLDRGITGAGAAAHLGSVRWLWLMVRTLQSSGYRVVCVDILSGLDVVRSSHRMSRSGACSAAPPCTEFSTPRTLKPRDFRAGPRSLGACTRMILASRPKWWALETRPAISLSSRHAARRVGAV